MKAAKVLLMPCILSALFSCAAALIEGLYCGKESCYDVLQVHRDATAPEIRRAYRRLALEYHPDKNKGEGSREKFQLINTAYEILKDEEERANYDYMLDNPEQVYRHYYHYYRRRVAPKVDIRVVIAVTITVISAVQYLGWWHSYNTAIKAALRMPQYRMKAKELATEKGLLREGQKRKGMSKEEIKDEEEAILWRIMEENLNVLGGYSRPVIWDILWFKIIFSPYSVLCYLYWYVRWVWLFTIRKQPYGPKEEAYLTRRRLGLSVTQWKALDEEKHTEFLGRKLWVESHWREYKEEEEEKSKMRRLSSSKYKMYKRYMKSRGQKQDTTNS